MIDIRISQVLIWQVAQAIDCVVKADLAFLELPEQFFQLSLIHKYSGALTAVRTLFELRYRFVTQSPFVGLNLKISSYSGRGNGFIALERIA